MSTVRNTPRSSLKMVVKALLIIVAVIVVMAIAINIVKQVQVHGTDGGQGGTNGGKVDSSSVILQ